MSTDYLFRYHEVDNPSQDREYDRAEERARADDTTVAISYIDADQIARVKAACQSPQASLAHQALHPVLAADDALCPLAPGVIATFRNCKHTAQRFYVVLLTRVHPLSKVVYLKGFPPP